MAVHIVHRTSAKSRDRGEGGTTAEQSKPLERITVRPEVLGERPIIRDLRVAGDHVLGMQATSETPETILHEFPALEAEDIQACLEFAHRSVAGEKIHGRIPTQRAT